MLIHHKKETKVIYIEADDNINFIKVTPEKVRRYFDTFGNKNYEWVDSIHFRPGLKTNPILKIKNGWKLRSNKIIQIDGNIFFEDYNYGDYCDEMIDNLIEDL